MNPFLLEIIQLVLRITDRHQQNHPADPPLTAEQVEAMLLEEVEAGENRDLKWFLKKGLQPPQ